jgi:hypothetical protein
MPPKKAAKTSKFADKPEDTIVVYTRKERDELALSSPASKPPGYTYPPPPSLSNANAYPDPDPFADNYDDLDEDEEDEVQEVDKTGEKLPQFSWTEEMMEQLVEVLHTVFVRGGAADNSFKKSSFEEAVIHVRSVYRGPHQITWLTCKNKWADTKTKWGHWIVLSKQSGIGFNDVTELYEFSAYTWRSLIKTYPKITWHKTHVMPFREMISYILHDVQANGDHAFTLEDPTPDDKNLDPELKAHNTPVAALISKKPAYNKLKRRVREEFEDNRTPPPKKEKIKKVDLATAIAGVSHEMALARKAKETYLSKSEKAVQLLQEEYKGRLDMMAFIDGVSWLQTKANAASFLTLTDLAIRDRMLEVRLRTELLWPPPSS